MFRTLGLLIIGLLMLLVIVDFYKVLVKDVQANPRSS